MDLLFHGFKITDHDEVYSRMNLISSVPLQVDVKDDTPSAAAEIEQTMERVQNVLSKHTRNIDSWLSASGLSDIAIVIKISIKAFVKF